MPEGAHSSDEALDVVNRVRQALAQPSAGTERPSQRPPQAAASEERRRFDFGTLPEYEMLKLQKAAGEIAGIDNPFYRLHDGRAAETTSVEGKEGFDSIGLFLVQMPLE